VRLGVAVAGTLLALLPMTATASASPDPQALRDALAAAPSSAYVEADSTVKGEGPLDASAYAAFSATDAGKQHAIVNGLSSHHFVAGYGRIWVEKAASVVLVEQILAFGAGSDARSYEGSSKLADTTSADYTGTIDTSSIPDSYGVEQLSSGFHAVAVVFAKGNDLLAVGFVSSGDYMAADALTQAEAEYATAPAYTIQPSQSSTVDTSSLAYDFGHFLAFALESTVVIGIIVVVVGLVLRSSRRKQAMVQAALPFTLSADGRFWWDGAAWQDSTAVAPPSAQRSPDGTYWWDGRAWRPVPPQPVSQGQ
jgi:hypothetical protein